MKKLFLCERYAPAIKKAFEAYYEVFEGNWKEVSERADLLFSVNFLPKVARYCHEHEKRYISWVVDCPHTVLYSEAFYYESNHIFLFDYTQFCRMQARGGEVHVYYLPLAADIEGFGSVISRASAFDNEKFKADVSFLGRLYRDSDHALYDQMKLTEYLRGYLDSMIRIQRKIWGTDILQEGINDRVWKMLRENVRWELPSEYEDSYEQTMLNIFCQKIAQLDRMELCSMLAGQFDFALYSQDETVFDSRIQNRGYVDYLREMPLVFANSKINVNVTLRSITTGIPLRCMDIMACGGFLLTNYQQELVEYFVDGEELVIYHDFEDLREKTAYYLEHEEERVQIARRGREKVARDFSYARQIGKIVEALEANE